MNIEQFLIFLLIGGVAGWLGGLIIKGGGFGIIGNIIVGIIGAIVGSWLFDLLNISVGVEWIGLLITATVGAIVLLFVLSLIWRGRR
jgi:uncharacterized membrane protein YeaQ/YmgE (transglycosylase-associated protein family)